LHILISWVYQSTHHVEGCKGDCAISPKKFVK
jgi:hypothetical protein